MPSYHSASNGSQTRHSLVFSLTLYHFATVLYVFEHGFVNMRIYPYAKYAQDLVYLMSLHSTETT